MATTTKPKPTARKTTQKRAVAARPTQAFGSNSKKASKGSRKFSLRKLAPFVIVAIVGAFGVYTLVRTFAATGMENGFLYVGSGTFMKVTTKQTETTQGYPGASSDISFNYQGDKVAYTSYSPNSVSVSPTFNLQVTNSDGTGVKAIFSQNVDGSGIRIGSTKPSWSRDGQWLAFRAYEGENETATNKIMIVHPDGTGLKDVTPENYKRGGGGATFSSSQPAIIHYFPAGEQEICALDVVAVTSSCVPFKLLDEDAPTIQNYQNVGWNMQESNGEVYTTTTRMSYDESGSQTSYRSNLIAINPNTGSYRRVTDLPLETRANGGRNIMAFIVAPDASRVLYYVDDTTFNTEGYANTTESTIYSVNTDGSNSTLFYDNLAAENNTKPRITTLAWQPYMSGTTQPAIPRATGGYGGTTSLVAPTAPKYNTTVVPTVNITNPSITPRTYTLTIKRMINGTSMQSIQKATVGGNETASVNLAAFVTPYAKSGAYTQITSNFISATAVDEYGYSNFGTASAQFALPMPPFTLTNPINGVAKVKKGTVVAIKGKTLPNKKVILYNSDKSAVISSTTSGTAGYYAINLTVSSNRYPKLCLNGYATVAVGCKALKLTVY